MFNQMTLPGIDSATFSPEWADGPSRPGLLDGLTPAKCGQPRAPASRSRSRAKGPELLMRGTYGPTFSASSVPDGPLSSWESRLRQRLARIGSSECDLTWKASAMSDGVLLSRLVPSTPRTVEIDSGLLLEAAYWPTCVARDWKSESATPEFYTKWSANPKGKTLPMMLALWSTPQASDGEKGGPNQSFGAGGMPLPAQAFHSSMWPTATAVDGARGLTTRPQDTGIPLPQRVGQALGIPPAGSSATTAKRGVLNPAFPCWLMGYPLAHLSCGAMAMQSFHRSRRKSSVPG